MAPTKVAATTRYFPPGVRKYYFLSAWSNYPTAPIRATIDAGQDVSDQVADVSGFTIASDQIEVPDLSGRFTAKIPGRITADDSSITFYASSNAVDCRTLFPRDTAGFMLILPEGDVAGQKMDGFPVKVASSYIDPNIGDPGRLVVNFSITGTPVQNMTIPA